MSYMYALLCFFISTLPGIYCAVNKKFVYTLNPKYNFFILRLFIVTPGFSVQIITFSLMIFAFFVLIFGSFPFVPFDILEQAIQSSETPPEAYVYLLIPLFLSFFYIFLLHQYVIPTEEPEIFKRKKLKNELFIYVGSRISDGRSNGTHFEQFQGSQKGRAPIGKQLTELIIMYKEIKGKDIGLSESGEFVLTQRGLNIFQNHQISGFYTRPVKLSLLKRQSEFKTPKEIDLTYTDENGQQYYQIITTSILPPLLPQTKIKTKEMWVWESVVTDSKLYYNHDILENISDLNQTNEYFGSTDIRLFPIQRFWIITKKVKDILIQDFDLHELDFIPVHLVDDEK